MIVDGRLARKAPNSEKQSTTAHTRVHVAARTAFQEPYHQKSGHQLKKLTPSEDMHIQRSSDCTRSVEANQVAIALNVTVVPSCSQIRCSSIITSQISIHHQNQVSHQGRIEQSCKTHGRTKARTRVPSACHCTRWVFL